MEKFGNGYKGRAATSRKMRASFRGFADHSPRSLKPVHGRVVGGLVLANVWRVLYQETGKGDANMTEQASLTQQIIRPSVEEIHASIPIRACARAMHELHQG